MLVESDDVRFGEHVTLARREIGDDVVETFGIETEPRRVASSLDLETQSSDFRFKTGSEVFGDCRVDYKRFAERSVVGRFDV